MDAVTGDVLGMVFSLGRQLRQLAGIELSTGLWIQMHHADGQRQQSIFLAHTLAVQGHKAAGVQMFGAIEASALGVEIVQQLIEPFAPILRPEHQQKVIAADMPDKVAAGVDPVIQALRQAQQHFIATPVAIDVVLRV